MVRRSLAAILTLVVIISTATAALAARVRVNAADNAVRWDSTDLCDVVVDDYLDHTVNLYCFGEGRAYVVVRVPGVRGRVTRVIARGEGDCSGKEITYRKRGDVVRVKILHRGDFDCTYADVIVRYEG
jgi:hypothetical protein